MSFGGFSDIQRDRDRAHSDSYSRGSRRDTEDSYRFEEYSSRHHTEDHRGPDSYINRQEVHGHAGNSERRFEGDERGHGGGHGARDRDHESGGYGSENYRRDSGHLRDERRGNDEHGHSERETSTYGGRSERDERTGGHNQASRDHDKQGYKGSIGQYSEHSSHNNDNGSRRDNEYSSGNYNKDSYSSTHHNEHSPSNRRDDERRHEHSSNSSGDAGGAWKAVAAIGIETFAKAYEKSAHAESNKEEERPLNAIKHENSAFGNRISHEKSELSKSQDFLGGALGSVKNKVSTGVSKEFESLKKKFEGK